MDKIIKIFKNLIKKPTKTSKYKVEGKCLKCGKCCSNIAFKIDRNNYIRTKEEFEYIKKFDKKFNHFKINGIDKDGAMLFKCKSLKDNNECKDYFFRSLYCRKYPNISQKYLQESRNTLEGCGYKIKPTISFKEFIKNS